MEKKVIKEIKNLKKHSVLKSSWKHLIQHCTFKFIKLANMTIRIFCQSISYF